MPLEALQAYYTNDNPGKQEYTEEPTNPVLSFNMEAKEIKENLFKRMADSIKKSELLRSKINKDIQAGADHYNLLMDAIKCISLMIDDPSFYERNVKSLQAQHNIRRGPETAAGDVFDVK